MIETFIKFMSGDLVWVTLGAAFSVIGWLTAGLFRRKWLRVCAGVLFVCAGIFIAHLACERLIAWWNAPLGPELHIIKGLGNG